jgi:hypothetical protein
MSHPTYCQKVAAADERHRVRVTCARAECSNAQSAALATYRQISPSMSCNEANATYRKAVADADRECARAVAESTRIRDSDIDAAFAEHRGSPEYVGAAR